MQAVSQKVSLDGFMRQSCAGFAFQKWYTIFEKHQDAIGKKWTGSSLQKVFLIRV
jgi:hypothetical protein